MDTVIDTGKEKDKAEVLADRARPRAVQVAVVVAAEAGARQELTEEVRLA